MVSSLPVTAGRSRPAAGSLGWLPMRSAIATRQARRRSSGGRMKFAAAFPLVFALSAAASAQHWFDALRIYPETDLGQIRIVEDMDADGDVDLVWIAEEPGRLWFNDGQGEFTKGPLHVPSTPIVLPEHSLYALQTYPVAGDTNGDGLKDVVCGINIGLGDAVFVTFFQQP